MKHDLPFYRNLGRRMAIGLNCGNPTFATQMRREFNDAVETEGCLEDRKVAQQAFDAGFMAARVQLKPMSYYLIGG